MNQDSQFSRDADRSDTRPILIIPYMWIGDFVRNHTVVRVLNERWPNRPVDLLTTSLCAPWSITCPACAMASCGTCRAAGSPLAASSAWRSSCASGITGQPWCCPGPGRRPSRPRWPGFRKGSASSASSGSACSTAGAGARRSCPASSTRTPPWPSPMAPPARGMAGAAIAGPGRGHRPLAAGQWPQRRGGGRAGSRLGRRLKALDLLSGGCPPAGRARAGGLGGWRPRRKGPRPGDRRRRRSGRAGPHRHRSAQRRPGAWPRPASPSPTIPA